MTGEDKVTAGDALRAGQAAARLAEGDMSALKDADALVKVGKQGAKYQIFCCGYLVAFAVFVFTFSTCTFSGSCDSAVALETNPGSLSNATLPESLKPIFSAAATKHNISPAFLAAIFWKEHGRSYPEGGPWASSPAGANGPFQFIEQTWEGWSCGTKNGVFETDPTKICSGYGQDGDGDGGADVQNLWDSAFSAADLLGSNGAAPNTTDAETLKNVASRYNSGKPWSTGQNIPETADYVPDVIAEYQRLLGQM